jgi:hypothetical protein
MDRPTGCLKILHGTWNDEKKNGCPTAVIVIGICAGDRLPNYMSR